MACLLCRYSCSEGDYKECLQTVKQYIIDSVGQVDNDEIARQVTEALRRDLEWEIEEHDVKKHIAEHMLDRKVVMSNIIKDLLYISTNTRNACMYTDESNNTCIDTKVLGVYLKTVDSITGIYRSSAIEKEKT